MKQPSSFSVGHWFLGVALCALSVSSCAQKGYQSSQVLRDVEILAADSMGGRLPNTPGHAKAQQYLMKRFKEVGLTPILQPFQFTSRATKEQTPGSNIIGTIAGKSEKVIVITAHYDHVGTRNGIIFNGADDDASGIGALLAIATHFNAQKPQHTLYFVAFDAEEQGLAGSKAFVENLPIAKERILLNVNMDMLSISAKNELYAAGTFHYPWLKPILDQVKTPEGLTLKQGHDRPEQGHDDWTLQSDHGSFHRKQIPFVYFGVEDHPHYHKETDEFKNIHQPFYLKSVETVLNAVQLLDKQIPL
ncbi:peptidase M20 [Rufibacter sp. DG15C]|uniref:M20/M25/M40 family metallo-hydrolase n=1 Tax=Rufibacter sp. DG15C TaxID=1379909 RepID=UPI00078B9700|nr:M20/M25/M40 family metallo-hydrolase [Rufibacter sp. DG15C]AMM52904.1 peptidase M20 [Rufibacter sp. DG15C]